MRARPKQANYLQKFKVAEPVKQEYGENGRRLTTTNIRDSSPVQTSGGPNNRQRAGPAGISNITSKASRGGSAPSSSSSTVGNASASSFGGGGGGGGGGDIKQYIDLDDVPDGLPLSPRWMSKKTISYYQGDDNPPDDNYWAPSSSSKAATHAALGPVPVPAPQRAPPPRAIPKQAFQPMRPHLHDDDDNNDGRDEYRRDYKDDGRNERDDAGYRDSPRGEGSRGGDSRGGSRGSRGGSRQMHFDDYGDDRDAAQSKVAPRRHTPGAAYRDTHQPPDLKTYASSHKAHARAYDNDDDDDDEWGDDSLRRDTPPSDRYDSYESAHFGGGNSKGPSVSSYRDAPAPRQSEAASSKHSPAPPRPPAPLHIQPQAPSLPCEMRHAPPLPSAASSDFTPAEQLYFSKQPRSVEYRPYTLEQYRMIKPKDYVEIANIRPGAVLPGQRGG